MDNLEKLIATLIDAAKELGLGEVDLNASKELLDNREYGLAFDTIITQLYEYEIGFNSEFYTLVEEIANEMNMSETEYSFLRELVRN